jgi:hypothetical protein
MRRQLRGLSSSHQQQQAKILDVLISEAVKDFETPAGIVY